jgi:hypothetical protein
LIGTERYMLFFSSYSQVIHITHNISCDYQNLLDVSL